jgi:SAM-dependent methyltransferase
MEITSCNLCGSPNCITLYHIPDLLLEGESEQFTLVKCEQCGFVYQNPRPTQSEMGQYYPTDYEPYYTEGNANWISRIIYQYGINKRARIINSIKGRKSAGRLLDIGCSTGTFLNTLKRYKSWEVWGVELSEYAAKIAQEQYKLNVFQGNLEQAIYPTNFFDIVTMWDVLEHLPDPSATLTEISRITKPRGKIVLRVPNYDSFDAKLFGPSWAGIDLPRHYYVFSKQNLTQLLSKRGFMVNSVKCNIAIYHAFVLSFRFWLKSRSIKTSLRRKIISILDHPVSMLLAAPIFYVYGFFLLGSEITVIATKKD